MINPENCTAINEILLTGFKTFQGFKIPIFILFLIIYLLTFCENVLIIYIIFNSAHLKALMFLIIQSMCVCDLLGISNVIPKFLNDVLCEKPTFTVTSCLIQLQVYGTQGDIASVHYVLMSYDRYLAICHPLRYASVVNNKIYLHIIIVFWIFSMACTGVECWLMSQLQFCGRNTIHHFFCDLYPFVDLATSDTTHVRLYCNAISGFMILITVLSVVITYVFIIRTICKISSASGRKKTFSTCSSHLIVFSMQYGLSLVYVLPAKVVTRQLSNTFTFMHFFWIPLVNPLIYSFNNKQFRRECRKKIKYVKELI
uniref:G-protein coupled receptors family 1 profile domain-containing protein n=1 Tax=Pyxicephalus adspersus TaxID=30357 RepID=A0AAV3AEM7_PYXAD|nr:TPA: hypothetical protein GDO54_014701 [Pyxicephalus adspersus]